MGNVCISTPHGTLGTKLGIDYDENKQLQISTPHGTLGTSRDQGGNTGAGTHFNSTRYIRNRESFVEFGDGEDIFQLHTVH